MMIKTESYKIFSEIYCRLIQLQWSYILAMDVGVYNDFLKIKLVVWASVPPAEEGVQKQYMLYQRKTRFFLH